MIPDWTAWPAVLALQAEPAGDTWSDWGGVVMGIAGITFVLVLAAVLIWQVFKTAQTRMTTQAVIARDQAFRDLAERVTVSQEEIAAETARISAEIREISARVAAMEKMLREVE